MSEADKEESIFDKIRADIEKRIAEREREERERQQMLTDWHGTSEFADKWNNMGDNNT